MRPERDIAEVLGHILFSIISRVASRCFKVALLKRGCTEAPCFKMLSTRVELHGT